MNGVARITVAGGAVHVGSIVHVDRICNERWMVDVPQTEERWPSLRSTMARKMAREGRYINGSLRLNKQ